MLDDFLCGFCMDFGLFFFFFFETEMYQKMSKFIKFFFFFLVFISVLFCFVLYRFLTIVLVGCVRIDK
jgi:hypothetical protein